MMQAAQLGVEPNTPLGQAYLIPYRNHGQLECQFQLGQKGLIDLAYRSGEITSISAHEVCENDDFEYELGLEEKLKHKPALKDRGAVILYYAVFRTENCGSSTCDACGSTHRHDERGGLPGTFFSYGKNGAGW